MTSPLASDTNTLLSKYLNNTKEAQRSTAQIRTQNVPGRDTTARLELCFRGVHACKERENVWKGRPAVRLTECRGWRRSAGSSCCSCGCGCCRRTGTRGCCPPCRRRKGDIDGLVLVKHTLAVTLNITFTRSMKCSCKATRVLLKHQFQGSFKDFPG